MFFFILYTILLPYLRFPLFLSFSLCSFLFCPFPTFISCLMHDILISWFLLTNLLMVLISSHWFLITPYHLLSSSSFPSIFWFPLFYGKLSLLTCYTCEINTVSLYSRDFSVKEFIFENIITFMNTCLLIHFSFIGHLFLLLVFSPLSHILSLSLSPSCLSLHKPLQTDVQWLRMQSNYREQVSVSVVFWWVQVFLPSLLATRHALQDQPPHWIWRRWVDYIRIDRDPLFYGSSLWFLITWTLVLS